MSDHHGGVHVHAPHEEMVAEIGNEGHGAGGLAQRVALTTAILATIGALFGYQSGKVSTEALMAKNDSISFQTLASDQWAFYQAKATREFLANNFALTTTDDKLREKYKADAERYAKEKEDVQKEATELVKKAHEKELESVANLAPHEHMALGTALMQVGVALAAVTLLTRKNWLYAGALLFAAAGIGVASWGALGH